MTTSVIANQDGLESFVKPTLMSVSTTTVSMENALMVSTPILVSVMLDGMEHTVTKTLMTVLITNAKTMQNVLMVSTIIHANVCQDGQEGSVKLILMNA